MAIKHHLIDDAFFIIRALRVRARHCIIFSVMKTEVVSQPAEKTTFATIRPGQWIRLAAIAVTFVAIILYFSLPQIVIAYQKYSNTSTAGVRDYSFPIEYISGTLNFFGNGYFSYYTKSNLGPEVLVSQHANFNGFALANVLIALVACGFDIWLTFTKKNEKWAKLTSLLFVISGLACFMGPIFFLASNQFGAADWTASSDLLNYWLYDSIYVHDAYGAIVTGIVFIIAAICFGVGTGLEGGNKDDNRQQED
jgi:hypothetical protein